MNEWVSESMCECCTHAVAFKWVSEWKKERIKMRMNDMTTRVLCVCSIWMWEREKFNFMNTNWINDFYECVCESWMWLTECICLYACVNGLLFCKFYLLFLMVFYLLVWIYVLNIVCSFFIVSFLLLIFVSIFIGFCYFVCVFSPNVENFYSNCFCKICMNEFFCVFIVSMYVLSMWMLVLCVSYICCVNVLWMCMCFVCARFFVWRYG